MTHPPRPSSNPRPEPVPADQARTVDGPTEGRERPDSLAGKLPEPATDTTSGLPPIAEVDPAQGERLHAGMETEPKAAELKSEDGPRVPPTTPTGEFPVIESDPLHEGPAQPSPQSLRARSSGPSSARHPGSVPAQQSGAVPAQNSGALPAQRSGSVPARQAPNPAGPARPDAQHAPDPVNQMPVNQNPARPNPHAVNPNPVEMAAPAPNQAPPAVPNQAPPAVPYAPVQPGGPHPPMPPGAQPPYGWGPPQQPQPPKRRYTALVLSLTLMLVAAVAGGYVYVDRTDPFEEKTGTIAFGSEMAPRYPGPDADAAEMRDYVRDSAAYTLNRQSHALLEGDKEGYLEPFGGGVSDFAGMLYENLAVMGVSRYEWHVNNPVPTGEEGVYDIRARVSQCFSEPVEECWPIDAVYDTEWTAADDELTISAFEFDENDMWRPMPWEEEPLAALGGSRTLTVVPQRLADELSTYQSLSEEGAEVADPWARWERPDRYLVFYADSAAFETWFGGMEDGAGDVLGYAAVMEGTVEEEPRGSASITVMGVDNAYGMDDLRSTVRHELGHAATRWAADNPAARNDAWWIIEGIAEYIDQGTADISTYLRAAGMREYVDDGLCDSGIEPSGRDSGAVTSAKYGCAYIAVWYFLEEYGDEKFEELFAAAAREGQSLEKNVEGVLGVSHETLMKEIGKHIRSVL
ncbi:hypothetical protein [Salininema proteolyticum]|uniref:Peptidase MA superfamily protein n=1 Tax=Salininema proteolyticum TaxID=1607685 RepID=A0ABV8U2D6_9ACTN